MTPIERMTGKGHAELLIRTKDEHLCTLIHDGERLTAKWVSPRYTGSVERWTKAGLLEWLPGDDGYREPRHTKPEDPRILERIRDYLRPFRGHIVTLRIVYQDDTDVGVAEHVAPTPKTHTTGSSE